MLLHVLEISAFHPSVRPLSLHKCLAHYSTRGILRPHHRAPYTRLLSLYGNREIA